MCCPLADLIVFYPLLFAVFASDQSNWQSTKYGTDQ